MRVWRVPLAALVSAGCALGRDGRVKVLKDADAMAYRTWIMLPTHPGTW